jgi:glutaminyl-peptide cyclotransferase
MRNWSRVHSTTRCSIRTILALVTIIAATGCGQIGEPTPEAVPTGFDGRRAYQHVLEQCALGARPAGSPAGRATADYIIRQLTLVGWDVRVQEFEYEGVTLRNLIGFRGAGQNPIILGAHYDTRPVADRDPQYPGHPVPGGNDGASGVAVLLELARATNERTQSAPLWLAFFDGEDRGKIDDWDWSVGAGYMARNLAVQPSAVVIVDMIGDADQQIFMEQNSEPDLTREIWTTAYGLGIDSFYAQMKWQIIDDHLPFVERGIPAALLIDFDYPFWHTVDDTADKVSPQSLENVGRVLMGWLER